MTAGGFAPDQARAARAAAALDRQLLSSFEHLADACGAQVEIDRSGLRTLERALAAGQSASPAHYGIHFDLLDAIAEQNDETIRDGFGQLAAVAAVDGTGSLARRVVALDAGALGARIAALYRRNIDADPERPLDLIAPLAEQVAAAGPRIAEAIDMIGLVAPELGGEVLALSRQIVLAAERPDAAHPFYGASTFFLWGAVFFNPLRHATAYEAAETLAHEAGHSLLTVLAVDEPLVRNPRAARYRAPIRQDPRPMEGIYHATFVLARTCLFNRAVAAAPRLPQAVRARAAKAAERDRGCFLDGYDTLVTAADMGGFARALIEDAARFVRDSA